MVGAPLLLQCSRLLGGGAVPVHDGAAGVRAVRHLQLAVQILEIERLLQAVDVHHDRRNVVGGDGAKVHRLLRIVRPHEQGRLVEAGVSAGIAGIAALGENVVVGINGVVMVAPEHDDDRLVHLREVVGQAAQHGVGIPDAGGKVFERPQCAPADARRSIQHLDTLVVGVVVLIIIGVILHRDGMEEDRRIGRGLHTLVLLDDLVGHRVVRDKAGSPVVPAHLVDVGHLFQTEEGVQTQIRIGRVAAPVFGPEAVDGGGLIALRLEVIRQREHGPGHMLLIGLAAVGQIGDGIAGQRLKLHIAGAAAEAGAVGPAGSAGLLQAMEVGGNIRVERKAILLQLRDIPVGLVHHVDDGGALFGLPGRRDRPIGRRVERCRLVVPGCGGVVQNLVHGIFRVVVRFRDLQIGEVGQKTGGDAVVAIIAVLHPGVGQNADGLGDCGLQEDTEEQSADGRSAGRNAQHTGLPVQLFPPAVEEEAGHDQQQNDNDGDHHAGLDMDPGSGSNARRLRDLRQIPREKRLTAQLQRVEIHRRRDTAENGRDQSRQRREPGQPVHCQPDEEKQRPCQKIGFGVGKNVLGQSVHGQTAAGDPLREHHKHQCDDRRESQPKRMEPGRSAGCAFIHTRTVPFTS